MRRRRKSRSPVGEARLVVQLERTGARWGHVQSAECRVQSAVQSLECPFSSVHFALWSVVGGRLCVCVGWCAWASSERRGRVTIACGAPKLPSCCVRFLCAWGAAQCALLWERPTDARPLFLLLLVVGPTHTFLLTLSCLHLLHKRSAR